MKTLNTKKAEAMDAKILATVTEKKRNFRQIEIHTVDNGRMLGFVESTNDGDWVNSEDITLTHPTKKEAILELISLTTEEVIETSQPPRPVRRIITWIEIESDIFSLEVYCDDDSYWSGFVTAKRWQIIQEEELHSDIGEANAQTILPKCTNEERDFHSLQYIPDAEQSYREQCLEHYRNHPNHYGLCAWCKHYWIRETTQRAIPQLTQTEYEKLSNTDGTSHGCCPQCAEDMKNEERAV